jgi:hypothetical protein
MNPNPAPEAWPAPPRPPGRVVTAAALGVLALLTTVIAVGAAVAGAPAAAVLFGFGALFLGHLAGLSASLLRRPRPADQPPALGRTDQGETGQAFPYARMPYYWFASVLGLVVLGAAGFVAVGATDGTAAGLLMAVVAAVLAVLTGWVLVVALRLAPGVIVLTPAGVYQRSLLLEHFVPWGAIDGVEARAWPLPMIVVKAFPAVGTRVRRPTGRLGAFEAQFLPSLVARAYWLGANAQPAYRALDHYYRYPGERPGLGTTRRSAIP